MKQVIAILLLLNSTIAAVASNEVGRRAEIIRLPIKYWIEDVAFSSDKNISVIDVDKYGEDKSRNDFNEGKKIRDETKTIEKDFHADWGANASASGGASRPSGKIQIEGGVGGGYKKNDRVIEHNQGMAGYVDTSRRSGTSTRTTTAQLQGQMLRFTLMFKNITTNEQTFTFFSEKAQYSGMFVTSLDDSCKFRAVVPPQHSFELTPGGELGIPIVLPITAENDIRALEELKARGDLGNSIDLKLDSQFYLKDNADMQWKMPPHSIGIYWDFPKENKDRRRYFINGDRISCEAALSAVSSEKCGFSNGALDKIFDYNFGKFDGDKDGVYVILAKVNGDSVDCLLDNTILSQEGNDTELRFVRIGTGELLRNRATYSSDIKAKCLAYIEYSLNKAVEISANDLLNATKLAREEKDYLRYAHFLYSMTDDNRKSYLNSEADNQFAMECTILTDNVEYFKALRTLRWNNANRTKLGFAAEKGSLNIIKWLLEDAPEGDRLTNVDVLVDGADDDDVGDRGKTPLYWAAKNGHLDVCQYLVSKDADINRKFFEVEGESRKHREYDKLIDKDIPDTIRNYIKAQREVFELRNSWWRSRRPNVSVERMRHWVDNGVVPNMPKSYLGFHWNLLSWAVELKDVALVGSLIDKGADVNGEYSATPNEKRTALMLACEVGDANLVAKLISKGANLYAHQDDGMNAFHYAIKFMKYNCAEILLDKLDIAKCSLVEELNLLQYVAKYCDDLVFCRKLRSKVSAMSGPSEEQFLRFLVLREKAEAGDPISQDNLGNFYLKEVKADEKAFGWFCKATENGIPAAYYNLSLCYSNGRGVEKDKDKAREYEKIAKELEYKEYVEEVEHEEHTKEDAP